MFGSAAPLLQANVGTDFATDIESRGPEWPIPQHQGFPKPIARKARDRGKPRLPWSLLANSSIIPIRLSDILLNVPADNSLEDNASCVVVGTQYRNRAHTAAQGQCQQELVECGLGCERRLIRYNVVGLGHTDARVGASRPCLLLLASRTCSAILTIIFCLCAGALSQHRP